jgi:hypothetical protein
MKVVGLIMAIMGWVLVYMGITGKTLGDVLPVAND